jgi:hypothetical protein
MVQMVVLSDVDNMLGICASAVICREFTNIVFRRGGAWCSCREIAETEKIRRDRDIAVGLGSITNS